MCKCLKIAASCIVVLMLWGTSLCAEAEEVCFSEEQAKGILINLEKGKICEKQIIIYNDAISERDSKIQLLQIKTEALEQKVTTIINKMATDKKIAEEMGKAHLAQIKSLQKPKWSMMFGSFGAGVMTSLVLVLLL